MVWRSEHRTWMKAGVPSTYLICICVGTLYHAIFRVVAIATPMKTFFFVASPFLRHICSVISGYSAPSPNTIVCHSEPANDANLCHSDASYKYKNCACAGVLSLFLQSYGRVRIHTGRLGSKQASRWCVGCSSCPMRPKHEQHSDVKPLVYAPGTGQ